MDTDETTSARRYSVKEIDELRAACERRWLFGTTASGNGIRIGRTFRESEKDKCVEELVRTYMLAGLTAEDIYETDRRAKEGND